MSWRPRVVTFSGKKINLIIFHGEIFMDGRDKGNYDGILDAISGLMPLTHQSTDSTFFSTLRQTEFEEPNPVSFLVNQAK